MKVVRLANALGAEVEGLDLARPLSEAQRRELRALWLEHMVLLFRGQSLTAGQLIAFSRNFGELERHDNYQSELRHAEHPELLIVKATQVEGRRVIFGQQWHSDLSYTLRPSMGSVLHCLKLPPVGGDTLFANAAMAYDALSPAMQRIAERLEAVHDIANGRGHRTASAAQLEVTRKRNPPVIQPVVRTHPETGRKALFVSEWMCKDIVGLSEEEGGGLMRFFCDHVVREQFTFRQQWRVGDVLMWDNRSTVHMALSDYPANAERELMRTSITGTPLGRPVLAAAA
jgi:taurine dioxygenase